MYARGVLAFTVIVSIGLRGCVNSEDNHFAKKGAPFRREKSRNHGRNDRNIQKTEEDYRKTLVENENGSVKEHQETQTSLKEKTPKGNLRFYLYHHHRHHHFHHKKLGNEEFKFHVLNSGHTSKQGEVFKFSDSSKIVKKDLTKPFVRKQSRKRLAGIARKNGKRDKIKRTLKKNEKVVQVILPTFTTDKRFMVVSGPAKDTSAKRKRFHFSHALMNALRLVLDKRNSFKKDANILDLAKALQSKDNGSDLYKNNSITTAVSRGLTQNGQRVRLVRVKDPGYIENGINKNGFTSQHRSKILQDAGYRHSTMVNPTQLGVSILKLLFGKRARLVTKPKYRHLLGMGRPNVKYLEGYGSKKQREELEREIEKENQMILLKGVKKHRLEETLAKSISKLINAMNGNSIGEEGKRKDGESQESKDISEAKKTSAEEKGRRKVSSVNDEIGTRKSWVLLKMPKKNEEEDQEKVSRYQDPESTSDNPSKVSVHEVATLGKKNNELSAVKIVQKHKPHVETSYDDIAPDDEGGHAGHLKKPSGEDAHTDTEARTVPLISYNLNGIKSKKDSQKLSDVDPNGLAVTLGKILKGIQESVKELREQRKPKEPNPEGTATAKITSASTTSHLPVDTSLQAKSDAVAKIPDLLAAVNKLLGDGARSSQLPSHSDMPGIPSDQASVLNVPTVDNDAAAARRYMDDLRASNNPLQLRPSTGYFDEPITSSVATKKVAGDEKSLDNVLFESDELATQRDTQATVDAIKLKEDLESFAERGLNAHNRYRALHHAQNLKWSDDLATQAEKMAYDMAMKGTIEKSSVAAALGYGENVAKITGTTFNRAGEEATSLWYAEIANYSFSDPRLSPQTDSFTQVVWKGSSKLGMGCARDLQTNDLYVVALYDPKGNDPVGLRSDVLNKGEIKEDVYASIFKRHRLQRKVNPKV